MYHGTEDFEKETDPAGQKGNANLLVDMSFILYISLSKKLLSWFLLRNLCEKKVEMRKLMSNLQENAIFFDRQTTNSM